MRKTSSLNIQNNGYLQVLADVHIGKSRVYIRTQYPENLHLFMNTEVKSNKKEITNDQKALHMSIGISLVFFGIFVAFLDI